MVGVLVAWYGMLFATGSVDVRRGRCADNVYYLGLLFTLVALTLLLAGVGGAGGDGEPMGAERMVPSFGIALVSTMAGIAGRVLLLAFEREEGPAESLGFDDPSERWSRGAPHEAVAAETRAILSETRAVVQALSALHTTVTVQVEQAARESRRRQAELVASTGEAAGAASASVEKLAGEIERARLEILQFIDEERRAYAEFVQRMNREMEGRVAAMAGRSDDAFARVLASTTPSIEAAAGRLATALVAVAERLDDIERRLAAVTPAAVGLREPGSAVPSPGPELGERSIWRPGDPMPSGSAWER